MRFKLLLFGVVFVLFGFIIAGVSCPSGSCPANPVTNLSGLLALAGIIMIPVGAVWDWRTRKQKLDVYVPANPDEFIDGLVKRLTLSGFRVFPNVDIQRYRLAFFAVKSGFEPPRLSKVARIVAVGKATSPSVQRVQDFSLSVTQYAFENPGSSLPRGLGLGVYVFPVIVAEDFDETVKAWASSTVMPKHWAATEFPVLVSTRSQQMYYSRKTPIWGAALYRGIRKFVETQIGSRSPPHSKQDSVYQPEKPKTSSP